MKDQMRTIKELHQLYILRTDFKKKYAGSS